MSSVLRHNPTAWLAIRLASAPWPAYQDAQWRAAIGRAYYAAFIATRAKMDDLGFPRSQGRDTHRLVAQQMYAAVSAYINRRTADSVVNRFKKLRSLRNISDYQLDEPIGKPEATEAVAAMRAVFSVLARI